MKQILFLLALLFVSIHAEVKLVKSERLTLEPKPGSNLRVTSTTGLHVREKPCDGRILRTLSQNTVVQYAGKSIKTCNYTWWLIKGAGFEGWSASNWLEPVESGSRCRQRNYPHFRQCDTRWGSDKLGSSSTICKVGCLITSVAMAMNGHGKKINGQEITPKNFNQWLMNNNGYTGNNFMWYSIGKLGMRVIDHQLRGADAIRKAVCENKIVTLNVDNGGHWVLAIGVNSNGSFEILDPSRVRSSVPANQVLRAGVYAKP